MAYSREKFAGPSGIDMPVLLELERLLKGREDADPDKTGRVIIGVTGSPTSSREPADARGDNMPARLLP
jgi:hypothetical protein